MAAINHRLTLANSPALSSAEPKNHWPAQFADLGMKNLHIDRWSRFLPTVKHARGSLKKLFLPIRDLVGMHIVLLRQFR